MNSVGLQFLGDLGRRITQVSTEQRLPTSVSSYPAFYCSRCTWHFCSHAHWGWSL